VPDQVTAINATNRRSHTPTERLHLVTELARQVTARHDLDDVLQATLAGLRRLVTFGGGSIQLLGDDGWIRLAAGDPTPPDDLRAFRIPLGSSLGGRVILTEHPIYVADVLAEPALALDESGTPLNARVSPGGVRSYFGVPLVADGRAIGLVQIDSPGPMAWDEDDRLLVLSVAPIVAAAIQNARAYARVDVLRRRDSERHGLVARIVDTDIDAALKALVALTEENPLAREQVDHLTIAIGRIRGALGDAFGDEDSAESADVAESGLPAPQHDDSDDSDDNDDNDDSDDVDLRVDDKTLT
jgi:GAF domain-containing protein